MAMHIEKSGIKLAAIYRPLNNIFINYIMEFIRKKYICKNQIKKGLTGIRQVLKLFKKDYSIDKDKVIRAKKFYDHTCADDVIIQSYKNILKDFKFNFELWTKE